MKLSLLLPSLFPEQLSKALATIAANTRGVDYEAVVVSPFEVTGPNVTWVKETERRGAVPAQATAFRHAGGDFIVAIADDALPVPGWADHALANYERRAAGRSPFCLGLLAHTRVVCTVFGIYYANFPFLPRAVAERIGYFSPDFHAHFGDVDFSLRIWQAGGRCEFSERPLIVAQPEEGPLRDAGQTHRFRSYQKDLATFLARWGTTLGAGWDTSRYDGFLLDVNPATQLTLVEGNSIYINDPLFKRLYDNFQANIERCQVTMTFPP